ncbi:ROK family transcriptional regulator [Diaminobutyricibacter tongyongensis]|uniref:ROK family transcriptional regulator n=1 Tax=Leifsonia tongyongensis TaxID=1268043 RepID=A0A6L9XXD0_9MICO|nr:ROK family transcriptional regulator [Diaminobutyricibacter tongyongensis]NEN05867.1 ROK family transcriptional regulator [Diaminobutyricibacter tongyongensis]
MTGLSASTSVGAGGSAPARVSDVRQRNRREALRRIILAGSTSRAELARDSGLSIGSVTNIATELIAEGLVVEAGMVASQGGRPVTLLAPNPSGAYLLGADVGERGVAVELFDLSMTRVDREFRGGREDESLEAISQDLREAVAALRERNPDAWERTVGIGLGLPGIVEWDADGHQVLHAQSLGWPAVSISELVDSDIPVFAENGAKTLAMAEMWNGSARDVDEALVLLLGRGVGLGIVSDGELAHGHMSSAGEWGHVKIERNGRLCRCGGRGCVEAYLGADAILDSWREAGGRFEGSGWRAIGELLEAERAGDPVASAVVEELVQTLGSAVGGLVNLTNPQRVVIGGWVGLRLMETLAPPIESAIRAASLDRPGSQFELVPCRFGGDTVALGAAMMPLGVLLNEPRGMVHAGA